MHDYRIFWKKSAVKDLKTLSKNIRSRIINIIDSLESDPRPSNCKKMKSLEHHYRIRSGNYRIIYSIFDNILVVEIIKIGHRKDIYK